MGTTIVARRDHGDVWFGFGVVRERQRALNAGMHGAREVPDEPFGEMPDRVRMKRTLRAHVNERSEQQLHAGVVEEALRDERLVFDSSQRTNTIRPDGTLCEHPHTVPRPLERRMIDLRHRE
jgi:hypothetical protein